MPFFNHATTKHSAKKEFPTFATKTLATRSLSFTFYCAVTACVSYSLYYLHYEAQREHEITSTPYKTETTTDIRNVDDFIQGRRPIHGSLESHLVTDKKTGEQFIKKGAHSADTLKKEFMYSRFLHAAFPDSQPQSYFAQEKLGDDEARFYTLSQVFPNSMDMEEFIRQTDWKEIIANKKVLFLDRALALDGLLAKQQDTKYANLVIRELTTHYEIISIDHEFAFGTSLTSETPIVTHQPRELIAIINDLHNPDPDNVKGMQGELMAFDFADAVFPDMSPTTIRETYEAVAKADTKPIIATCRLYAVSGTLFALSDCDRYEKRFAKIQKMAQDYNQQHPIEANNTFKRN